jgi:predicted metal-dependent TIM-barrel fold hydrolase
MSLIPAGPKGNHQIDASNGIGIVNGTKHPDESWEIVKAFMSKDAIKTSMDFQYHIGYNKEVLEPGSELNDYFYQTTVLDRGDAKAIVDALASAVPMTPVANGGEVMRVQADKLFDNYDRMTEKGPANCFCLPLSVDPGLHLVSRGCRSGVFGLQLYQTRVVCVGEIGFEPSSRTCPDLHGQEELVRREVRLSKEVNVCLDFHVPLPPDQKRKYSEKSLSIYQEYDFPMNKVAIDHCTGANLEVALNAGAYAAISVQPWRSITPEIAAYLAVEFAERFGPDRIMIDTDCGSGPYDPLAVAKTTLALRQKGVPEQTINKVCSTNAKTFYGIPDKEN